MSNNRKVKGRHIAAKIAAIGAVVAAFIGACGVVIAALLSSHEAEKMAISHPPQSPVTSASPSPDSGTPEPSVAPLTPSSLAPSVPPNSGYASPTSTTGPTATRSSAALTPSSPAVLRLAARVVVPTVDGFYVAPLHLVLRVTTTLSSRVIRQNCHIHWILYFLNLIKYQAATSCTGIFWLFKPLVLVGLYRLKGWVILKSGKQAHKTIELPVEQAQPVRLPIYGHLLCLTSLHSI